jgi:hypothetical protein
MVVIHYVLIRPSTVGIDKLPIKFIDWMSIQYYFMVAITFLP